MATSTILIFLDIACILWIIAVMSDPWAALLGVIEVLFKFIVTILAIVPIGYGLVLKMNGIEDVFGHVCMAYVFELVGLGLFLGGLMSLNGVWSIIKGTAVLFQLMISLPATFVLCTVVYFTW